MATQAVKFNIDLSANPQAARQLEAALKRVGETGRSASREVNSGFNDVGVTVGRIKGMIAGLAIGGALRAFVRNTIEAEENLAQLDAILRSTGEAAGYSRDQLLDMARSLAGSSVFDVQQIISAQTRLLSYSGIVGENLPRAMQAVIDQSQRLGISVEQSAETIGRALESPSKAAAALAQQGFGAAFTTEVRATIDALVAAGREAEAQIMILEILEESYAGAAAAARDTFGGAIGALKNAIKTLLTGDVEGGGLRGARDGVEDLTKTLNDPQLQEGFQNLLSGALTAVGAMARFAATTTNVVKFLTESLAARMHGPALDDVVRVEDEIDRVEKRLETLRRREGMSPLQLVRDRLTSRDGTRPDRAMIREQNLRGSAVNRVTTEQEIEFLDAYVARLRQGQQMMADFAAAGRKLQEEASEPVTPSPVVPVPGATGGKSASQQEAERLLQLYERTSEALRRQVALFNDNSESAGLLYDLQHGALRDLEPGQKAQLEWLGKQLEALRALANMEAKKAEDRKAAEREAQAFIEATTTAEERYQQVLARAQHLHAMGLLSLEQRNRVIEDATRRLADQTESAIKQFEEFGIQAARNLQSAFADFLFDPFDDGLRGMLRGFVDVVRRMLSEAMAAQLLKALFGKMEGAAEGREGGFWGMLRGFLGSFGGGSAKGNVFKGGAMVPFANGGIVKGPITFPMANGQFGLMGEAAPEAIMPLRRGPGGRLGVDAGGAGRAPEVNIRQITVLDPAELAGHLFSAQNERVIVQYLDRLGFGSRS